METSLQVRDATSADLDGMAGAAGRAFGVDDDPAFRWIFGGTEETRARQIAGLFKLSVRHGWSPDTGRMFTVDGNAGVAVWASPGHWKVPTRKIIRAVPGMLRAMGPRAFVRVMRCQLLVEKLHPHEEHWYLQWLAIDPPLQRRGVGSALLQPILDQCDREGLPAYLETQKLENVAYYRRHGFEVRQEIQIGKSGPPGWLMWREPRS